MSRRMNLNRHEWLLLSAYLDGELSAREKRQVEEKLQQDPASRTALEGLRRTRQVLRHTPLKSVPRNFTLTEDMLRKPLLPSFTRMFSYSAALAGLLLVVVLGLDLFRSTSSPQLAMREAQPAMESFKSTDEDTAAAEQAAPQIIYWGNSGPLLGAYGKGGGGDGSGMAYGLGGGGGAPVGGGVESAPSTAMGEFPPEEAAPLEETAPLEEAAPLAEAAPVMPEPMPETNEMQPDQLPPSDENLPLATPMPEAPAAGSQTETAPARELGSSPILGVRPADQQGRVEPQTVVPPYTIPQEPAAWPLRQVEWVLAGLALALGLAAFLSRRFSH
ncbi:MAG: hypothetical protein PWQ55_2399 [Chloroflexota bacterium]|nr:hypothetical protein [Chloroflexota bacterium]